MKNLNITTRLTLLFVIFAGLLLLALSTPAALLSREALRRAALNERISTAIEKESTLNGWVQDGKQEISGLAGLDNLRTLVIQANAGAPGAGKELSGVLKEWVATNRHFVMLMVIDAKSGRVLAATDASQVGKFREDREYFKKGLLMAYAQSPYYEISLQRAVMMASAPIPEPEGATRAVLAGELNMENMNEIIQRRSGLNRSDDAFLVNPSSLPVTLPRLGTNLVVLQSGIHTEAVSRCLQRASGAVETLDYRDVPAIVVYRWLPERELCLIVKIDQQEAYAPSQELGLTLALVGLAVMATGVAGAWLMARSIARPVLALEQGAARFGAGDLAYRVPVKSNDEIGHLGQAFNHMAGEIAAKEALLRAWGAELETRVEQRTAELRQSEERYRQAAQTLTQKTTELERSNRDLERFAYVASHDLQEPLRMVASYLQLLERRYTDKLDDNARDYIGFAVDGATRMKGLINDLLAYSRIGTRGKEFGPTDFEAVLANVLRNLEVSIRDQQAQVTHTALPTLVADGTQIEQLLQNLISNAIKFHGEKPPRVHVAARQEGDRWLFSVSDNGIGIEPQYFERIFIIFQRLHTRQEYEGTGIGLAVSKRIVERHGGRIWIESQRGQGSTFYFTIPIDGETA